MLGCGSLSLEGKVLINIPFRAERYKLPLSVFCPRVGLCVNVHLLPDISLIRIGQHTDLHRIKLDKMP